MSDTTCSSLYQSSCTVVTGLFFAGCHWKHAMVAILSIYLFGVLPSALIPFTYPWNVSFSRLSSLLVRCPRMQSSLSNSSWRPLRVVQLIAYGHFGSSLRVIRNILRQLQVSTQFICLSSLTFTVHRSRPTKKTENIKNGLNTSLWLW